MDEETIEYEGSDTLVHEANLDEIGPGRLSELFQIGSYLVGTTDKGVSFRQRIPVNKILDRVDGKYVLKDAWK